MSGGEAAGVNEDMAASPRSAKPETPATVQMTLVPASSEEGVFAHMPYFPNYLTGHTASKPAG